MKFPQPDPSHFDEFQTWWFNQGKSKKSIYEYKCVLKSIPQDVEAYFSNPDLKDKYGKVFAYRAYLKFLSQKMKLLSRGELADALDTIKPPKKRGNAHSDKKWSIPKHEWVSYLRKSPNRIAKMAMWLGFNFGLRKSELIHLRIQDVDFKEKKILIREHKEIKKKDQIVQFAWQPKYNRFRQLPITKEQVKVFKRWINEIRPENLNHSYLLYIEKGPTKGEIVKQRTFTDWMKNVSEGFHAHVLRYSFATHYYNESKNVKLIGEFLGHSSVGTTSEYLQLGVKETLDKGRALFAKT